MTPRYALGEESAQGHLWGTDLVPGFTARAVCFEVKPGPWEPLSDKEFALWAPAEDDPTSAAYSQALLKFS